MIIPPPSFLIHLSNDQEKSKRLTSWPVNIAYALEVGAPQAYSFPQEKQKM